MTDGLAKEFARLKKKMNEQSISSPNELINELSEPSPLLDDSYDVWGERAGVQQDFGLDTIQDGEELYRGQIVEKYDNDRNERQEIMVIDPVISEESMPHYLRGMVTETGHPSSGLETRFCHPTFNLEEYEGGGWNSRFALTSVPEKDGYQFDLESGISSEVTPSDLLTKVANFSNEHNVEVFFDRRKKSVTGFVSPREEVADSVRMVARSETEVDNFLREFPYEATTDWRGHESADAGENRFYRGFQHLDNV